VRLLLAGKHQCYAGTDQGAPAVGGGDEDIREGVPPGVAAVLAGAGASEAPQHGCQGWGHPHTHATPRPHCHCVLTGSPSHSIIFTPPSSWRLLERNKTPENQFNALASPPSDTMGCVLVSQRYNKGAWGAWKRAMDAAAEQGWTYEAGLDSTHVVFRFQGFSGALVRSPRNWLGDFKKMPHHFFLLLSLHAHWTLSHDGTRPPYVTEGLIAREVAFHLPMGSQERYSFLVEAGQCFLTEGVEHDFQWVQELLAQEHYYAARQSEPNSELDHIQQQEGEFEQGRDDWAHGQLAPDDGFRPGLWQTGSLREDREEAAVYARDGDAEGTNTMAGGGGGASLSPVHERNLRSANANRNGGDSSDTLNLEIIEPNNSNSEVGWGMQPCMKIAATIPYTLHPIPYTLYPIPNTLYPMKRLTLKQCAHVTCDDDLTSP